MPGCLQGPKSRQVQGEPEAFCSCRDSNSGVGQRLPCSCGEELNVHEWTWDNAVLTSASRLILDDREVHFHPGYSSGTAAVRGNRPFVAGCDYYWEIKVLTPLYGTDVMIGVGTERVDLEASPFHFCSLLGSDEESWAYSYSGVIQHKGKMQPYGPPFGQGSIIGIHLDMWKGTLQFYLNRKPLGVAFTSLHGRTLYPMLCSTAAKSAMRVTYSSSFVSTLQLLCLKSVGMNSEMVKALRTVPFLRSQIDREYWWLIPAEGSKRSSEDYYGLEDEEEDDDVSLASFCASLSGVCASSSNSSSRETECIKQHTTGKRKRISVRKNSKIEPQLFCDQCDTQRTAEDALSMNKLKN